MTRQTGATEKNVEVRLPRKADRFRVRKGEIEEEVQQPLR